ncbi:hypothetical protein MTo_04361 [Microcystis aeruginosa NIES-1211]|uniref:hypothetical protein n=1 Tax=Microcystis TaxID=1125 RepID=UPI000D9B8D0F|nr:hypothetical protein MTo_04361 [Microcystis aeruginosa NIES-1211]
MNPTTANYNEPWKEALSEYFEAFLYLFFPEVHLEKGFFGETHFLDFKTKNVSLTNFIQLSVISD